MSIKNWVRQSQVQQVVSLLSEILENHSLFDQKTVVGTLKALATLIDWNEITLFDCCMGKIFEFLSKKKLRSTAFQCLGAIVGKGRPTVIEKLTIIDKTNYSDHIEKTSFTLMLDYANNSGTEPYEEEKAHIQAVSESVSHMGKWCIGVLQTLL